MRRSLSSLPHSVLALAGVVIVCGLGPTACSAAKNAGNDVPLGDAGDNTEDTGIHVDGGGPGFDADPDGGGLNVGDSLPPTEGGSSCSSGDCDKDGYIAGKDDCNDLDGTINPEAYDFSDDKVDNDCDGTVDNPVTDCAPTPSANPQDFARAADLCAQRSKTKAGAVFDPLVKAEWWSSKVGGGFIPTSSIAAGNTHPTAVLITPAFGGNAARMGKSLIGLASGPWATTDPGKRPPSAVGLDGATSSGVANPCTAIPLDDAGCKSLTNGTTPIIPLSVNDYTELRISIKVPSNAQAMLFDFSFFSSEFSEFWHTSFNDAFFALATTSKFTNANVAKDSTGSAITVNSGFFQLCPKPPGPSGLANPTSITNCVGVGGDATKSIFGTLVGTNYDGAGIGSSDDTIMSSASGSGSKKYIYGGGSGWLTTKFAVTPGETITLRLMIMDTSDAILDSAAIVDHMTWEKAPPKTATGETDRPPA